MRMVRIKVVRLLGGLVKDGQTSEEKKPLYFEAGAKEFRLCHDNGDMRFYNPQGELERSEVFGEFPGHIDIEVV